MMAHPLPTHGELLYPVISQEEKHKSVSTKVATLEPCTTLLSQNPRVYKPPRPKIKERPFCIYCKRLGHMTDNCYMLMAIQIRMT